VGGLLFSVSFLHPVTRAGQGTCRQPAAHQGQHTSYCKPEVGILEIGESEKKTEKGMLKTVNQNLGFLCAGVTRRLVFCTIGLLGGL